MKYHQISKEERYAIAAMRGSYVGVAEIARRLGRHRGTIYRELRRNASAHDGNYRAVHAVWHASGRQKRSRRNLRYPASGFTGVECLLRLDFSPEQVVGRMRREGRAVMSHETIYKWIWRDKKHGGSLWTHLRGARKRRRKRYAAKDSRGRLAGKTMIGERPLVVEERSRIGDWEIDTVHGKGKAGVVTVVERRSGVVRIGKLARITVKDTGRRAIGILGPDIARIRTITADNGSEFHGYRRIERALGTKVYFATPHHSWERGSNENTNGLIRQYLPKGMPLENLTQRACTRIAKTLNDRPRKRLGFRTPNEVFHDL